jgi:hypothetical protein
MKRIMFLGITIILSLLAKAQISNEISVFNDFKISYIVSSMTPGGFHFKRNDSLIPFGVGLETSVLSFKRFSFDVGLQYRTTGNVHGYGIMFTDPIGYSGPFYEERSRTYFDIPLHLGYNVFKSDFFNLQIVVGSKTTYEDSRNYVFTDIATRTSRNSWNTGVDIGLVEKIKIYNKVNFFASQFRNKYIGEKSFLRTIDLKFGLAINLR